MKNKITKLLLVAALGLGSFAMAQVGVNTDDPLTTMDIRSVNATSGINGGAITSADGMSVPRTTTDMRDDATVTPPAGVVPGQLVYSTNANSTGFWYWTGVSGGTDGAGNEWDPFTFATEAPAVTYASVADDVYTVPVNQIATTYTGAAQATWTLPSTVPVGAIYVIHNESSGFQNLTFTNTIITSGKQVVDPSVANTLMHIGSGTYIFSIGF